MGNSPWYTYENKNDRPLKVMARGHDLKCQKDDIVKDLKEKGFKVLGAVKKNSNEKGEEIVIKWTPPVHADVRQ